MAEGAVRGRGARCEWRQACSYGTWLMLWESEICDEREKRGGG